jgi:mono/diheme cytochrome c family protein
MKGFVAGVLVGVALIAGSVYFYFVSGMAPAAVADPPMLMEHKIASKSLDAHIENAHVPAPPIQTSEDNYIAGAKAYKEQCSMCHGLPNQPAPFAEKMFPHAPLLFKGKGVTDDPPQESYWKVKNGIRLTGMPTFSGILDDNQMWQVALLVANADKLPDSAKKLLVPDSTPTSAAMSAMPPATPGAVVTKK